MRTVREILKKSGKTWQKNVHPGIEPAHTQPELHLLGQHLAPNLSVGWVMSYMEGYHAVEMYIN
jgi:hypothetical protein